MDLSRFEPLVLGYVHQLCICIPVYVIYIRVHQNQGPLDQGY